MLTAPMQGTGVGISEQHSIAQPRAHLTGSLQAPPRFQHKKSVEMYQPWASRKGGSTAFSYCSAAEQQCKGPVASLANACTPPRLAEDCKSLPNSVVRAEGCSQPLAGCSAQHRRHASTICSNALPASMHLDDTGTCCCDSPCPIFPSQQAGCVSARQPVCLCPPRPQRTQLSGAVLPRSLASSCWSNSML